MGKPKISIVIVPEKNSKNLSRTMLSLFTKTDHIKNLEVIVGLRPGEEENRDLQAFFMAVSALQTGGIFNFQEIPEDLQGDDAMNRAAEYASGDWILPIGDGVHWIFNHWDSRMVFEELIPIVGFTNEDIYLVSRETYNQKFKVAPMGGLK